MLRRNNNGAARAEAASPAPLPCCRPRAGAREQTGKRVDDTPSFWGFAVFETTPKNFAAAAAVWVHTWVCHAMPFLCHLVRTNAPVAPPRGPPPFVVPGIVPCAAALRRPRPFAPCWRSLPPSPLLVPVLPVLAVWDELPLAQSSAARHPANCLPRVCFPYSPPSADGTCMSRRKSGEWLGWLFPSSTILHPTTYPGMEVPRPSRRRLSPHAARTVHHSSSSLHLSHCPIHDRCPEIGNSLPTV